MTAQFTDNLHYQGEQVALFANPLNAYFSLAGVDLPFDSSCSALRRGYVASWEISQKRLYLVRLKGSLQDGTEVSVQTVFPGFAERVFAHWYSGMLRLPQGEQLKYEHMGYASVYERDELLCIERGVLVSTRTRVNSLP